MKKFFIIGNGFDLQHNIKSRYQDFHAYFRSLYVTQRIEEFARFPVVPWRYSVPISHGMGGYYRSDIQNVLGFLDYTLSKSEAGNQSFSFYLNSDWWNIEHSLGNLDLREEFDEEDEKYLYQEEPLMDKIFSVGQCFSFMNVIFSKWVSTIDISFVEPIDSFSKLIDNANDWFMTFNYTRTLEDVYHAKNVFHIHGIQGERVEFGHKKMYDDEILEYCIKNKIPTDCKAGVEYMFDITEKDTMRLLKQNQAYFTSLDKDITEIYSYGFSFSLVDMPYIFELCHSLDTSDVTWYLSDFDSNEKIEKYKNYIIKCGFKGKFNTFHIDNNSSKFDLINKIKNMFK